MTTLQTPRSWSLGSLNLAHSMNRIGEVAGARLLNAEFWRVQVQVALVTALHFFAEARLHGTRLEDMHWIPPVLYIFPILYASLKFRTEGGVLTSLWCGLLMVPNIVLWHLENLEWVVEVTQLGVSVVVGLVVGRLVDHEAEQRRVAESMAGLLALLHRQVTYAQEDERRRVARELHDETTQSLILLCRRLDEAAAVPGARPSMVDWLEDVRDIAEDTLVSLRRFIRDLRPPMLDDLGLIPALEWLTTESAARQHMEVELRVTGEAERLPPDTELALFRIVQEALRNAEKHSEAATVAVDVSFPSGGVLITVQDDGHGFDIPASLNDLVVQGRLGLVGMQDRAQLLGGTLAVDSRPGKGTTVSVRLASLIH